MNRYSDLSTSTYKPLSLQEIMMVPMAKQKQHDEAQAMADEYSALSSNRLSQDAELVDARLGELRGKADAITNSLLEKGVDRDAIGQLNKLKREKELEFSQQGLIGNAQSNYSGAMSYVNELASKKERQAGWSPAQAKAWAQKQVMEFQGTKNEDGSFNAFSGRELNENVDEMKWVSDGLKDIASNSHPEVLKFAGNLNQFTKAYQNNQIDEKTYNDIMKSLVARAQYDPKLQASLTQKGEMRGTKGENLIGEWKIDPKSKREYFQPQSEFGAQLSAAAMGAKFRKQTSSITTVEDQWAMHMAKRGLDQQDADNLAIGVNGQMATIDPIKYDDLQKSVNLGLGEMKRSQGDVDRIYNELIKSGKSDKEAKNDPAFKYAQEAHNDSTTRYHNAKSSLDNIINKSGADYSETDKKRMAVARNTELALRELEKFNANGLTGALNKEGINNVLKKYGSSYDEMFGDSKSGMVNNKVYETRMYNLFTKREGLSKTTDNYEYSSTQKKVDDVREKTNTFLKNYPYAQDYINFSGNVTGEYKGKIGAFESKITDTFNKTNGQGWSHSYTGGNISDVMQEYPKENYNYNVMVSNGQDNLGYAIETLSITDKKGTIVKSVPVTRGKHSNMTQYEVGKALVSHPTYSNEGSNMMNNYEMMPKISSMKIHDGTFKDKIIPGLESKEGLYFQIKKYPSGRFTVTTVNKADALKGKMTPVGSESVSLGGSQDIVNYINGYK